MGANEKQVGGKHYQTSMQHWDYVVANNLDYFQGQITLYVTRWKKKGGIEDLRKAQHFLEKYIEIEEKKHPVNNPPKTLGINRDCQHPFGYNPQEE